MPSPNLNAFFSQWQHIAQIVCQQGIDNLTPSIRLQIQRWQQDAELLGLAEILPLSQQLTTDADHSPHSARAFAQLLVLMQALERSAISWKLSQPIE
ncbi:hypothetical protein ABT56_00105 [Photobacterium aquae]|uniref:Uncharacterized protein n=1 Tax=Photobacterium aquae TaxID=1195763 RepID=A0A0J1HD18_9GAMM|nr:hypothetical protein [Photobacterium aquae]KLV09535.1 hypothetical protein ABT56_00105 [Photobacterium aquae]